MNFLNVINLSKIRKSVKKHIKSSIFDMSLLDAKISAFADNIYNSHKKDFKTFNKFHSEIAFIATELYDTGGHTPCLINLANSIYEKDKIDLYLSNIKRTLKYAPKNISKLNEICNINGVNYNSFNFVKNLIYFYNLIIKKSPKIIIGYCHQHDIFSVALLHLLKKNTEIKFIFFNHASHTPSLGMTIADLILECMPTTVKITNEKRHLYNTKIIGLQSKKVEDVKHYSPEEINKKRQELNLLPTDLVTVSGGASYKYFEKNGSKHFEMIKRLLELVPNLKHLAIINLSSKQEEIINKIFANSSLEKNRLIFHPTTPDYDILFQCGDLFIDSFPVSSAMTQIDLMSMKVPTVVKINTKKPELSFHEYMPEKYPYMYEQIEDMEKGILYLLSNKEEQQKIIKSNYDFWLNNYESDCVRKKYIEIFNNLNRTVELVNFLEAPYEIQLETRNWRNSENVAKWFKIPHIDEETHKNWLKSLKEDSPRNIAFLIKYNKDFVGVTYFHSIDYKKKEGDWGIYIYDQKYRGLGLGESTLSQSIKFAFKSLGLKTLFLDVLNTNEKAKKLYTKKGFEFLNENGDFSRYKLINKI